MFDLTFKALKLIHVYMLSSVVLYKFQFDLWYILFLSIISYDFAVVDARAGTLLAKYTTTQLFGCAQVGAL